MTLENELENKSIRNKQYERRTKQPEWDDAHRRLEAGASGKHLLPRGFCA